MKLKKVATLMLTGVVIASTAVLATGCSSSKKDYDVYLFNTKSEIADSITELAQKYEDETGKKVKVYTSGTEEAMETLRSEMNSKNMPTLYSVNQAQFVEWDEGGFALSSDEVSNTELKSIYDSIPSNMTLNNDSGKSYGIPYNVEGYGLIADSRVICDLFGLDSADSFIADYKAANYEEFQTLVIAVDKYIEGNGGETVKLNGNEYVTSNEKTELTENLNGVFAIAGAEKWTYGNHFINYALNAVFPDYISTANATADEVNQLEEPMVKILEELTFLSDYTAGPNSAVERGADYINSTITGYDQAVQTFSEGKSLFIKQGNWIYSTVASISQEKADNLTMLPMKVNLDDSDITAKGVTVEKLNSSIPEFVSQYYVINAKASDEEKAAAEEFLLWLNTSSTGLDYITNKFAFVPFNAGSSTELDNPLSNSLIEYMENNLILGNDFDAFPTSWGLNTIGAFIQEKMFTSESALDEDTIRQGVKDALSEWVSQIN